MVMQMNSRVKAKLYSKNENEGRPRRPNDLDPLKVFNSNAYFQESINNSMA